MNRELGRTFTLGCATLALSLGSAQALAVGLPSGAGNLNGAQLILTGDANGDRLGQTVFGGADFNGDGTADIAVSAPRAGKVYVLFGGSGAIFDGGGISVGNAADQIFTLQATASDSEHYALTATDLDRDGIDDLVIGNAFYGATDNGQVWVVYGSASWGGGATLNVETASDAQVLEITTSGTGAQMGFALAGGFNIDESASTNTEDLLIGAPGVSRAFMIYGKTGRPASIKGAQTIGSFTGSTSNGGAINGDTGARLGAAVSLGTHFTTPTNRRSAIFLGAPGAMSINKPGGDIADCGAVYGLLPGGSGYPVSTSVPGGETLSYTSACNFGPFRMGTTVHLADVYATSGTAYPDLLFGGPTAKNNGDSESQAEGRIWFRAGSSGGPSATEPYFGTSGQPHLKGDPSEQLGQAIASADIDGDGTLDVLLGSTRTSDGNGSGWSWSSSAGQVYVYLSSHQNGGTPAGLPDSGTEGIFVGNLDYASSVLVGENNGEDSGASVSRAGDLFKTGFEAFVVGAPSADVGGTNRGRVYVYVPNNTVDQDGDGYSISSGDCNEGNPAIHAGVAEICGNAVDENCDGIATDCGGVDGDGDGYNGSVDCDDGDPSIYPGAPEVCDGDDNDCDTRFDEGVSTTYYPDGDGDGYGDEGSGDAYCSNPGGGFTTIGGDCNDGNPAINPGAEEQCGFTDYNCNGESEDGLGGTYYDDHDGDGYGDPNDSIQACDQPNGYVTDDQDCDDDDADLNPETLWYLDSDQDNYGRGNSSLMQCIQPPNYAAVAGDCDDLDPLTYPTATEQCDGKDNDCAGGVPANELDADGDGAKVCEGDCNDGDPDIGPGEREVCDGKNNDCDGQIDEGVKTTYYADSDGDTFGDPDNTTGACSLPNGYVNDNRDCDDANNQTYMGAPEICDGEDNNCDTTLPANEQDLDGDGQLACGVDCDDQDATVGLGFAEICDDQDNDCDLQSDEGFDGDGDGYYVCFHNGKAADCNDNAITTYPGAGELCDGKDNDCDGDITDEQGDEDGDGFSPCPDVGQTADCNDNEDSVYPGAPAELCDGFDTDCDGEVPAVEADADGDDYRTCDGDCDDTDGAIAPNLDEICDGKDNDCNGETDDGVLTAYYEDADGDGKGSPESQVTACAPPNETYVTNDQDCDDTNSATYQGANEICDGEDNNCDDVLPGNEADGDGDLVLVCEMDCNDADPEVYTGRAEVCDGKDNDCNTEVDEGFDDDGIGGADCIDDDGDGLSEDEGDCFDNNAFIYLGAEEIADGLDNDCDTIVDEGLGDTDDDGDGYSENQGDCDDEDADAYPAADEVCGDGIDNNCNDLSDEGCEEAGFFKTCAVSGAPADLDTRGLLGFLLLLLPGLRLRRRLRSGAPSGR